MIQEVKTGKDTILIDFEKKYSGKAKPNGEDKTIRKAIGLPLTKKLIYYPNKRDSNSAVDILQYQIVNMFDITDRWFTIEILTESGEKVRIHSSYLVEMQKPSFIEDMAAQMGI